MRYLKLFIALNVKEGVTFLLAEQNTNVALRYATYGYILESGRVVMDGVAAELRENEDVKEFYLGIGGEGRKSFRDVKHYKRRQTLAQLDVVPTTWPLNLIWDLDNNLKYHTLKA